MMSILISKIISTESFSVNQMFENKGKVYTYLNPGSYLTALDNKELLSQMDGIFSDGWLLVKAGYQGISFTCGGFIHQTSKNEIDYYPAWGDKTNLRFVYRMWKEPHTRKRFLIAGLLFQPSLSQKESLDCLVEPMDEGEGNENFSKSQRI